MSEPAVVAVFGSSATAPGTPRWVEAENVGRRLADVGLGVVTGGYGGSMEAVSRGAATAGGHVIGVTSPALFPGRSIANAHVGRLIEAPSLTERIGAMMSVSCGVIALPGSIGTATELLLAWNINHIVRHNGGERVPTVAVGEGWGELHAVMTSRIGASPHDVQVTATGEEATEWLLEQPEVNRHLTTQ